jgi:hypothetical protein
MITAGPSVVVVYTFRQMSWNLMSFRLLSNRRPRNIAAVTEQTLSFAL